MRSRLACLTVFAAAALYFCAFRRWGFQVEDEGTLLFQLSRVVRGQTPYADFHTGYTPGFFYLGAFFLDLLGGSTLGLRPVLAVVNAATAAALYAAARRVAGPWLAALPALVWVAFIPVPGGFASFNVPYPAWFATLAWMGVALSLLGWTTGGGAARLVAAGLCAALAFAVKPNAGAFALAGSTWTVLAFTRREGLAERLLAAAAAVAMALGVWWAFAMMVWGVDAAVHLSVVAAVAGLWTFFLPAQFAGPHSPRALRSLTMLGAAFIVPTAAWLLPLGLHLGAAGLLKDVFLVGSNAAELYYLPHPLPEFYGLAVVVAVAALALGGRLAAKGAISPWPLITAGAAAFVAVAVWALATGLMPESPARSLAWQLENSSFWLAPAVHWGALAFVFFGRASLRTRAFLAAMTPLAAAMYLQLYPRTDFMHLMMAAPLTAVVAVALLDKVLSWWVASAASRTLEAARYATVAAVAVALLAAGLRLWPALGDLYAAREQTALVATATVSARAAPGAGDDLEAMGKAAAYLAEHARGGEHVLAFPAMTGLLFAAGLDSPVTHDYWYPGRPDHFGERRMIEGLKRSKPRFAVTINDGWTFFFDAPAYFSSLGGFVRENYRLAARFGRFDILARHGVKAPAVGWQPAGPMGDIIEPDRTRRRQAVRRWMASLTIAEARSATLPADRREAVLMLRALRDGGDLRTAPWLLGGLQSKDARVREEALKAAFQVSRRFDASRQRWAGDLDPGSYFEFVTSSLETVAGWSDDEDPRARRLAGALAVVATARGGS